MENVPTLPLAQELSAASASEREQILQLMPQKKPFLFIDRISELSEQHIIASRTFQADEFYFQGHFPGNPITPGVILIETMAQTALVALGIYLLQKERPLDRMQTLFSDCNVEFLELVRPGDTVTVHGKRTFWRRNKLKSEVELKLANGKTAAVGTVSGMGVFI